jgi:hypothetical protein
MKQEPSLDRGWRNEITWQLCTPRSHRLSPCPHTPPTLTHTRTAATRRHAGAHAAGPHHPTLPRRPPPTTSWHSAATSRAVCIRWALWARTWAGRLVGGMLCVWGRLVRRLGRLVALLVLRQQAAGRAAKTPLVDQALLPPSPPFHHPSPPPGRARRGRALAAPPRRRRQTAA